MKDILIDVRHRPLFLGSETDGVARTEPVPDKYGSAFTMYSRKADGTEFQMSTAGERSKAFVTRGKEITREEYEKTRQ